MKNKKVVLGGGIAVILIIIIIAVVISKQPTKISVEDYVSVTYRGFNGYANAYATLDKEELYNAVLKATGRGSDYNDNDFLKALSSALKEDLLTIRECIDNIELTLSQQSNLSNGDTIIVEITYDNEMVKNQKIQFTGSAVALKVEDLEDAVPVDPFEGLEVSFTGTSPNGWLEWNYTGSNQNVNRYGFSADPSSNLKNGDTVTITYNFNEAEAQTAGYVITKEQMEYEVSGLDEYVQNFADLTEDFLEHMKSEANDKIKAYTASSYSADNSLSDLSYAGYILNTQKDGGNNQLYLIYSGNVSNTSGVFPVTKVYYPVRFSNIMSKSGELSYNSLDGIQGSSSLNGRYSTSGYVNPVLCYMEIVERNMEYYNSECGDGFEVFAEFEHLAKLSDIDDSYKQELYQDAKNTIESYIASNYSNYTASELTLVGDYLLAAKNPGYNFVNNNSYIVVYSAQVTSNNNNFEETTVYFPVLYRGIVSLPNGESMMTQSSGLQGSSNFPDSYYSTRGYVDGQKMFTELITANVDNYTYDVSDGLKKFGE